MSSSETEEEKNTGGRSSSTPEKLEGAVGRSERRRRRERQKQLQIDRLRGLSEITLPIDRIEEGIGAS